MRFSLAFAAMCALLVGDARAQTLDQEIARLAADLSRALKVQGFRAVAAPDFTDLQGRPTELGRFVSEKLTVAIVASQGVPMVSRASIGLILAEQNLTVDGLVKAENAKKLGDFAGVDAFLRGTVTALDDRFLVSVLALTTDSARLVAAGEARFSASRELQLLHGRLVTATSAAPRPASDRAAIGGMLESAPPIATKDYGNLRVVLRSIAMAAPIGQASGSGVALRIVLDMLNLDARNPIVVAANVNPTGPKNSGSGVRSTAVDSEGATWDVSAIQGLSYVRAGARGSNGSIPYEPTDVTRLLRLRDRLGRDSDDPTDGADCRSGGMFCGYGVTDYFVRFKNQFVAGSTTLIETGSTLTVSMILVSQRGGGVGMPKSFDLMAELVVGSGGAPVEYKLHNVTFDGLLLPRKP